MALAAGTRLGPYTITASIGAGGMGEVYKSIDTRLDRTVAIKVLPEHIASDPALKQRFELEAKTLAALTHPHICPVFDVGSQHGVDFLVMEYMEGETLEQRLRKGPLSPMSGFDLWALPLFGDRKPVPVATREFDELNGQLSRDMRWVAYESNDAERFEIVVQQFPNATRRWQISLQGGMCRAGALTAKSCSTSPRTVR